MRVTADNVAQKKKAKLSRNGLDGECEEISCCVEEKGLGSELNENRGLLV